MAQSPRKTWGDYPVRWLNRHAVMSLPEHIDLSNVGEIREQLLSLINRDVPVLIADMSATIACDHAGAAALGRVYQRAVANGTELRLVVRSEIVRRVLSISGVDRLVSIYPTLEAALAPTAPPDRARSGLPAEADDVGLEVALLDRDGVIVSVNDAWEAFALANGGDPARLGKGVSYLDVCAAAGDDPVAGQAAAAIRQALAGELPGPLTIEVPCHSPGTARWFDLLISTRRDDDEQIIGAAVTLTLTRSQTLDPRPAPRRDQLLAPGAPMMPATLGAGTTRCRDIILVMSHRLFGVGLDLQGSVGLAGDGPLADRLQRAIDQLDAIIRDARKAVFSSETSLDERR